MVVRATALFPARSWLRPLVALACLVGLALAQPRPPPNPYWGKLQRAYILGGPFADESCYNPSCSIMEPFLSRDGRFLFFNSENVGNDTTLHYAAAVNATTFRYLGRVQGEANNPIPHLDAVPALDRNLTLYWISTRDYPDDIRNVMTGRFDEKSGGVPAAQHLAGDIYIQPRPPQAEWIVMDQEANDDGSLLFYSNARFVVPTAYDARPNFSNISLASVARNGSGFPVRAAALPNGPAVLRTVNEYRTPSLPSNATLKYSPASHGNDSLELLFAALVDDSFPDPVTPSYHPIVSGLFAANRTTRDAPFGPLTQLEIPIRGTNDPSYYYWYSEPEAPTFSPDGKRIYFTRIDCTLHMHTHGTRAEDRTLPSTWCSYHLWTMERA